MSLSPEHGIRYAFGVSLRRRLYLLLTPRRRCDGIIGWSIDDALECVCDARQFEGNLVGTARPFQQDNSFSAEVKSSPEKQSAHDGNEHHHHVVRSNGDASACDGNQVVRKQGFLLAGT